MKKYYFAFFSIMLLLSNLTVCAYTDKKEASVPDGNFLILTGNEYLHMFADESVFTLPRGTISFWMKMSTFGRGFVLFSVSDSTKEDYDSDFNYLAIRDGRLEYVAFEGGSGKSGAISNYVIEDNADIWHHIALVADNIGSIQLYVDGNEITDFNLLHCCGPKDYFIGNAFRANTMNIGIIHRVTFIPATKTNIDDFSIYSRTFTSDEILKLRDNTLANPDEGRVVYYTFDELEDLVGNPGVNDFRDMSGNGNHGELRSLSTGIDVGILNRAESLKTVELLQNYPNPFSENTSIRYNVSSFTEDLKFEIFDVDGRIIYKEDLGDKAVGEYSIPVNRKDLTRSNIYYYSLSSGDFKLTKKLMVM